MAGDQLPWAQPHRAVAFMFPVYRRRAVAGLAQKNRQQAFALERLDREAFVSIGMFRPGAEKL